MKFADALRKLDFFGGDNLPIPTSKFMVLIGMSILTGFQKVTNIGTQNMYEQFVEGGNNSSPVYLIKPNSNANTIVFEKGVGVFNPLSTLHGVKFDMVIKSKIPILIMVLNQNDEIVRLLAIKDALPVKWEMGDLNAMSSNDVLVDKLTIIHSGVVEIPITAFL